MDNVIVVDNAPKVGSDRMEKLKMVLNKVFSRFGDIVTQFFPVDEKNVFKGCVCVCVCVTLCVYVCVCVAWVVGTLEAIFEGRLVCSSSDTSSSSLPRTLRQPMQC